MERVRNRPKFELKYSVLPRTELSALKSLTSYDAIERQRAEQEERELLKKKSETRVGNWPNTIEALRLRKEQDRKDRLAQEEAIRCTVDIEEVAFQQVSRKAAIERANLILYEQDDRIKNFNSKMFLSHVLEERQLQEKVKEDKKKMELEMNDRWDKQMQEQLKRAREEEDRKRIQAQEKAKSVHRQQNEQLEELKSRKTRERKEEQIEGLAIRAGAERAIVEEIEEEIARKDRGRALAKEYESANEKIKRAQAEQAVREHAEELKIQRFAQLKEEQLAERHRRMEAKTRSEMERRQMMIDFQSQALTKLKSQQEQRISHQMRQLEVEKEIRESSDKSKAVKLWSEIQQSRSRQLRLKDFKKKQNEEESIMFRKQWGQAAEQLLIEELESRIAKREK